MRLEKNLKTKTEMQFWFAYFRHCFEAQLSNSVIIDGRVWGLSLKQFIGLLALPKLDLAETCVRFADMLWQSSLKFIWVFCPSSAVYFHNLIGFWIQSKEPERRTRFADNAVQEERISQENKQMQQRILKIMSDQKKKPAKKAEERYVYTH